MKLKSNPTLNEILERINETKINESSTEKPAGFKKLKGSNFSTKRVDVSDSIDIFTDGTNSFVWLTDSGVPTNLKEIKGNVFVVTGSVNIDESFMKMLIENGYMNEDGYME